MSQVTSCGISQHGEVTEDTVGPLSFPPHFSNNIVHQVLFILPRCGPYTGVLPTALVLLSGSNVDPAPYHDDESEGPEEAARSLYPTVSSDLEGNGIAVQTTWPGRP